MNGSNQETHTNPYNSVLGDDNRNKKGKQFLLDPFLLDSKQSQLHKHAHIYTDISLPLWVV